VVGGVGEGVSGGKVVEASTERTRVRPGSDYHKFAQGYKSLSVRGGVIRKAAWRVGVGDRVTPKAVGMECGGNARGKGEKDGADVAEWAEHEEAV